MKKLVMTLKLKNSHQTISNDYLINEFLLVIIIIILSILFPFFSKGHSVSTIGQRPIVSFTGCSINSCIYCTKTTLVDIEAFVDIKN
jgi:hypothetical protein